MPIDAQTLALLKSLMGSLTPQEMAQLTTEVSKAAEEEHPTVKATKRFQAALMAPKDVTKISGPQLMELGNALDDKVATHGGLSAAEIAALFRLLLGYLGGRETAVPVVAGAAPRTRAWAAQAKKRA
jgi:hypothetical protein